MDYDEKLIDECVLFDEHKLQIFQIYYPGGSFCQGFDIRIDGILVAWYGDTPGGWLPRHTQPEADRWSSAEGRQRIGEFDGTCHRCGLPAPPQQLSIMLERPSVHLNPQMCIDALKAELETQKRS